MKFEHSEKCCFNCKYCIWYSKCKHAKNILKKWWEKNK